MTDPNDADDRSELQAAVPSSLRRNGPPQELKDSWEPGPGYADTWGPYYSAQFPPTKVTPWTNFKRMGSGVNVVRLFIPAHTVHQEINASADSPTVWAVTPAVEARSFGSTAMPRNRSCGSYGPGHLMHWIQGKKSHEDGQPIIKVKVVAVHDDGRAEIEGDELKLTLWYHDPDRLRRRSSSVAAPNGSRSITCYP